MVVTWIELEEDKVLGKSISHFKTQDLLVFGVIYQYEYIVCIFTVVGNRLKATLMCTWKKSVSAFSSTAARNVSKKIKCYNKCWLIRWSFIQPSWLQNESTSPSHALHKLSAGFHSKVSTHYFKKVLTFLFLFLIPWRKKDTSMK